MLKINITNKMYIMDELFQEFQLYAKYKTILLVGPLEADCITSADYCHYQKCYTINNNSIKPVSQKIIIKDIIECLYFMFVDFGEKIYDDKYWFFVGKLNNGLFFAYESGCCGTGFGLGSESSLYLSKTQESLYKYGLTNTQRNLIATNISQRFVS